MPGIFKHTDTTDDTLTIDTAGEAGAVVYVQASSNGVWLTPDAVTSLREALEPYDPATKDAKQPPATAIEAGREYRLLPGARSSVSEGVSSIALDEVTRVRVRYGPDGDGDYYVTTLDGNDPGERYFVMAKYLAPLDEPAQVEGAAPTLTIVDETHVFRAGDLTDKQAHALADGAYLVTPESFPLDARRVAALKLAAELAGPASIFGGTSASTVLDFAAFLLDELAVDEEAA